jgi:hypothetical protein
MPLLCFNALLQLKCIASHFFKIHVNIILASTTKSS